MFDFQTALQVEIERLRGENERLREALTRIEDLTSHGMGMDAGEETVVWREANNALKGGE